MAQPTNMLDQPELSALEQDVLDEYARLAENMQKVAYLPFPPSPRGTLLLFPLLITTAVGSSSYKWQ